MKRFLCLFLCLVMLSTLSGCGTTKYTDYSFDYFDTVTTIIGFEKDKATFDRICAEIKRELSVYHRLYNIYNKYNGINNLASVNQTTGGEHTTVSVDAKIINLLSFANDMYNTTNGKLNVAFGSVLNVWHQHREEGINNPPSATLPSFDVLKNAAEHTDINNMVLDAEKSTVYLRDPQMRLDVGAVAKGYAVEQVALWMKSKGYTGYILNVGGNVRCVGRRADGEKWKVGIENPDTDDDDKPYIEYLLLEDMSLVTSGSYQRFYVVDGKNYHHIIDPSTLMPGENFLSVSVLTKSSALADALSTALFTMSFEDGFSLVAKTDGVEAMWVMPNGEQKYSEDFKKYCSDK